MAKQVVAKIKLQAPGGQATPAPPIGPALGQHNVNIGQFISQFNERTKQYNGTPIPVEIYVYADKTFSFITKSPPAAILLKQAAGIVKGSGQPNKEGRHRHPATGAGNRTNKTGGYELLRPRWRHQAGRGNRQEHGNRNHRLNRTAELTWNGFHR